MSFFAPRARCILAAPISLSRVRIQSLPHLFHFMSSSVEPSPTAPGHHHSRSLTSSPTPPLAGSPHIKRQRLNSPHCDEPYSTVSAVESSVQIGSEADLSQDNGTICVPDLIPIGIKLVKAMKRVSMLEAIGYCPTKDDDLGKHMMICGPEDLTKDDVDFAHNKISEQERDMHKYNTGIMSKISDIHSRHAHNVASGELDKPFALHISKGSYEFDDVISPEENNVEENDVEEDPVESRLKQWYDIADVSGYGDVREQVTKVDKEVRSAREISAHDFSVQPELVEHVVELWDKNLFPNTSIRAEPYKIHLYGPGDHFLTHRDTPQKDLIGTLLLGLGQTADCQPLEVEGKQIFAVAGLWCGFYPDVPHCVSRIEGQEYRAVIAFKIFRTSAASEELTATSSEVRTQVRELVDKMQAPFGIMLEHKYCLGTTHFNGFDALLWESVLAKPEVDARHLPVVMMSYAVWGTNNEEDIHDEYEMVCGTDVYPFTQSHIDALLQNIETEEAVAGGQYSVSWPEHSECGCPWLQGVEHVPFFSYDLRQSLFAYREEEIETCNYVGNEAQAWRDDSVYLSYALLVLPSNSRVEAASSSESSV